jgi:hypothetical protein
MAIIHYPGLISKEEAARRKKVQVRTINIQINKKTLQAVRIDDRVFVRDTNPQAESPPPIQLSELEWVSNFAAKHHIVSERIYEQIIIGKITGIVVANRVFVMRNEPALLAFMASIKN